jgi:hypothetical protein
MESDEKNGSRGRGLRTAVVILVILSIAASAFAVAQRNDLTDERARADRLEDELGASREKISELDNEGRGDDPKPPEDDVEGDPNPFDDVFGGDIEALLECIGTGSPSETSDTADNARAQLKEIAGAVEELRGLRFDHKVHPQFLSAEEVAEKAARITLRDYPQKVADAEGSMLQALGAIPRGTDLRRLTEKLIASQVAGFYVPSTDELVVPGNPDEPLEPGQKIILAHELTHAVADGRLEIPLPEHPDPADLDKDLAALAVVEGDATLLMQRWATTRLSIFDQLSLTNDPAYQASQEAIAEIPPYLVEQLTYPYVDGLNFTCDLYAKGGWQAVNRAYAKPPTSTAQVLFPERYAGGQAPVFPTAARAPKGAWKEVWDSSFGAANLLWLFKAPGGDESAAMDDIAKRVKEWRGGTVRTWTRGDDIALALRLSGGSSGDLCGSIAEWYDASFDDDSEVQTKGEEEAAFDGEIQSAVLDCPKDEVHLGVGPDLATAYQLAR